MDKLYITHYYYPGTDPWKNIVIKHKADATKFNKTVTICKLRLIDRRSLLFYNREKC